MTDSPASSQRSAARSRSIAAGSFGLAAGAEVFEGRLLLEASAAYASGQGGVLAAGDFVFAEHLQELEMPELAVAGLGQAGVEGVEHAPELEGFQCGSQAGIMDGHRVDLSVKEVEDVAGQCV